MIHSFFRFLKNGLTKWDMLLIALLAAFTLISFSLWFRGGPGHRASIIVDGESVKDISLVNRNGVIPIQGSIGTSYIEVGDGRIRITDSPCPHKICVKTGWISHEGQMICCLPNKVLIRIINVNNQGYDAFTY